MRQHSNKKQSLARRAITLTEVLIAMGILAIGLLGVASVFPVGGYYMQSGDIADRGGAIAQAALEDAIIRGYLDPDNWVVHDLVTQGRGLFIELNSGSASDAGTSGQGLRVATTTTQATVDNISTANGKSSRAYRSQTFGDVFVIDPLGIAGALERTSRTDLTGGNPYPSSAIRHFPAIIPTAPTDPLFVHPKWSPWNFQNAYWPVRRVTTVHTPGTLNNATRYSLQAPIAKSLFSSADDLAISLPDSGDAPARQRWEIWGNGTGNYASTRQSRGDYSWIISVAPASSAGRDALATTPDAYPVEVSAVVFYKRTPARDVQLLADAERLVDARVVSVTPGGGELLLSKRAAGRSDSPFEDLRTGQYVMVVGPHPLSSDARPMLAVRWCRLLNLEDSGRVTLPGGGSGTLDRDNLVLAALRGPDWPWRLSDPISQDLRVAIVPGAVAVHTKTMRLEAGSEWSID